MYYGDLLPTLFSLQYHLENFSKTGMVYLHGMDGKLQDCLEDRFLKFFRLDESNGKAISASVFHPTYQMQWIPENLFNTQIEEKIIRICAQSIIHCQHDILKKHKKNTYLMRYTTK